MPQAQSISRDTFERIIPMPIPRWRFQPTVAALLLAIPVLACAPKAPPATAAAPKFYTAPDSTMRALPFSEAVQVGSLLFASGQIGVLPGTTTLAPGGITPEAKQAIENVQAVLKRHGASLKDVVKCTVFLADIKEWPAFNEVYRQYFSAPFPARSALAASGLAFNARVEVECVAAVKSAS
jgi:2-iminobutanoate/2-iminopropanoate deaminase